MRRTHWWWIVAVLILIGLSCTPPGRAVGGRFFASLRIAKPQAAAAGLTAPAAGSTRQIQDAIAGMVSPTPKTVLDEPARNAANVKEATALAGFPVQLVTARSDTPSLSVVGARDIETTVERQQLRTILDEAGEDTVATPAALQGAPFGISAPRAVRAEYGHCPAPVANTIQGQLQGSPPPSTDYGDCVVLQESPAARVTAPPGLNVPVLADIALQLSGMSPDQTAAFDRRVNTNGALALSLPRFVRSYDTVSVNGAPAMLFNTAGRRGPTYALVWSANNLVFQLSSYGNPGGAVALASSVR